MRKVLISLSSIISFLGFGQQVESSAYEKMLNRLLIHKVPQTEVSKIDITNKEVIYLDAREEVEYNVSHVENAMFVGYKKFSLDSMQSIPKDTEIIVYCSVGFRSGSVSKKLIKNGYTNVLNLYGGLFEWSNQELPLVDNNGKPTLKIHTYNKKWGKWIEKGEKVCD
jgi:rhodanese-related sulfurtransferase